MPMPRWDRFRVAQKDESSSVWHISSPLSQPKNGGRDSPGIYGGSERYSYAISGGAASKTLTPERDHFTNCHQDYYEQPPLHATSGSSSRPSRSPYLQPPSQAAAFAARQLRNEQLRNNVRYSDANGVSPPSSPDPLTPNDSTQNPGDVSPIDEIPELSQLTMNNPRSQQPTAAPAAPRSNIPTMRRERRRASDAQKSNSRDGKPTESPSKVPRPHGKDVRWDPRTGEPTTSDKGRKSQIDPHEYVKGLTSRTAKPLLPSQIKKSQETSPKASRDRPAPAREPTETPSPPSSDSKPQWRGASGRTSLVPPVNDTPAPPLILPRKSSKRTPNSPHATLDTSPLNLAGQTRTPQSPATRQNASPSNPQAYPSPPFSDGHASPVDQASPSPRSHQPPVQSLRESLHIPSNDKAIRRKPAAGPGHQPQISTSSSVYSQLDLPSNAAPAPAARTIPDGPPAEDWVQPPSRFSVTTYATSQGESPRQSMSEDVPPVPTPPKEFTTSILDRKRPMVPGYETTPRSPSNDIVRIDLDSSHYDEKLAERAERVDRAGKKGGPRPSTDSTFSLDKNLPLVPPEMETGADRVALLNARLSTLGNRRINLNTAIRQMTELMPTDHVLASDAVLRKREAEKKKVDTLRMELAEVERETYDLGLKLHRAYKRLEREAEYEPTTLWVRRCTG